MKERRLHDSKMVRIAFITAGVVALALGVAGIVLPVLPTTPFILLAAACFARGSGRLHAWILAHRFFGPIVRDWHEHRSMPAGVKPWAFFIMAVSFGSSIALVDATWLRLTLLAIATILSIFLWRIPERKRPS